MKKIISISIILIGSCLTQLNAQCTAYYGRYIDPANNGQVTFMDSSVTATSGNHHWDFGDGNFANDTTGSPFTHTFSSSGTYNVCLTVSDSIGMFDSILGCHNTYCSYITVANTTATCNAYYYYFIDSVGGTTASNFVNGSSGTITNYLWDFGDGTTSTIANPGTHTFASGGNYTVCLTTTNPATLCNSTYCVAIFISSCTASFTYTPDATGNGVSFYGNSTGTSINYSWDFGDGSFSSLQNPYHVYAANGSYNVHLNAQSTTDSTCYNTTAQYVTVSGICDANFSVVNDSLALLTTYWIYNYSSGAGTVNYLWDFGDGSTSTAPYPTHTYATSGPFLICLTISDGIGCSDTQCDSIGTRHMMSGPMQIYVIDATGIQQQANTISSLENYPNPFSDNTTISYSIKKDASVELSLLDLLGNKIAAIETGNRTEGKHSINWNSEGIAQGMYLLQLKVDNNISTKKLMISK